ncbi:DUF5134 domain-containing protein [Amycolatopsis sp. H20-H5]|uniref:DUF5134 domain-containing protein n=1 Tax=Amycolatopsis sp. H20-H5 TaxID=3046309 RepID=UPI002DBB2E5B|nr:DUF5134 domain-containing protein [Amycolatopsis sp. H20-H5]MEC3977130.1 DUF5134 domain-containing protein [Amycolatopsis sp. H20-H5]
MHGPVVVAWILTVLVGLLALPCVLRLARLDYVRLGQRVRNGDVAELLLVFAMVAMLSPVGGPVPAAGWQAVFALTAAWFAISWWRGRRPGGLHQAHGQCSHHAISALAMLAMLTAMPHGGAAHGPWLTMSAMAAPAGPAWPVLAIAAAAYFAVDAVRAGVLAVRAEGYRGPDGLVSRAVCRSVMGVGMGYMLLAAL